MNQTDLVPVLEEEETEQFQTQALHGFTEIMETTDDYPHKKDLTFGEVAQKALEAHPGVKAIKDPLLWEDHRTLPLETFHQSKWMDYQESRRMNLDKWVGMHRKPDPEGMAVLLSDTGDGPDTHADQVFYRRIPHGALLAAVLEFRIKIFFAKKLIDAGNEHATKRGKCDGNCPGCPVAQFFRSGRR